MAPGVDREKRLRERRVVERRWRETVEAWRRSGQDERLFCRRQRIGLCAFRWWQQRFGEPADGHVAGEGVARGRPARRGDRQQLAPVERRQASDWVALWGEWQRSGLSTAEFCARRGLPVRTFQWWRWRFTRGDLRGTAPPEPARDAVLPKPPAFLPVQVVPEVVPSTIVTRPAGLDVVLRGQRRIRVGSDFDAQLLTRLVRTLEAIA